MGGGEAAIFSPEAGEAVATVGRQVLSDADFAQKGRIVL
jgi:hypothetical protein